jgi:hypothetical protein
LQIAADNRLGKRKDEISPENLNWIVKRSLGCFFPSKCLNKRRFYSLKAMLHFVLDFR